MNEQEFHAKLGELISQINELPDEDRVRLERLAHETQERHEKMRKTVRGLQESLDHLRLSVKYLVFDLEATRRENDYLRKMIEGRGESER
ncbi:MAG: transcriptional regulator [Phycisphaeraceae bacterium]|nr:transcriptional regulator [Phycisphaeraceae bacterium]